MPASAILGAQWGDEGKGKLVDLFSSQADIVVRFQGGPNAGHTVEIPLGSKIQKVVFHHIPSGLFWDTTQVIMGDGMVVNPETLLGEIDMLAELGIQATPDRLLLSLDAKVILPIHGAIDRAREGARDGGFLGTTLRGIGPTYEDHVARRGIRFRDTLSDELLQERLERLVFERNALLAAYDCETFQVADIVDWVASWRDRLAPFYAEARRYQAKALQSGKRVLFEGAQGSLLDLSFGTYPYVTSSNTTTGGILTGTGLPPNSLNGILGVTKAYTTRVGEGPFPSELKDDVGDHLATHGNEFGATTGRPRRCGWLDLVALKHATDVCGFTSFAITKLDVLSGLDKIGLCTAYQTDDGPLDHFPNEIGLLDNASQTVEWVDGWDDPTSPWQTLDDLPTQARAFLDRITELTQIPISVVSVGPRRDQSIILSDPLWTM